MSPGRCCVRKPVPHATSSVRAGRQGGERGDHGLAFLVPARPVTLLEDAGAEPPVVVLRRPRLVVRLHAPRVRVVLEAVPNFSEGRDEGVIDALRGALSTPARLLDVHVDADHHRSVFTLVGERGRARGDAPGGDRVRARADRPAPPRRCAPADRRRRRRPDRADQGRRPGAGEGDGARSWRGASGDELEAARLPLRRARARPRAGVLPARRPGGAAAADRRGRAGARLRAGAAGRAGGQR